jgi:hypothetical protein
VGGLFGRCFGRAGFGLGIEAAFSLVPPPIVLIWIGRTIDSGVNYSDTPATQSQPKTPRWSLPFSGASRMPILSVSFGWLRPALWFHICMPCYPGSGWGRQLWSARYPGLGNCWGLVGVG